MEFDIESPELHSEEAASENARLVEVHRAQRNERDDRGDISAAVRDFFRRATLNGFPISLAGSDIQVSPAAMTARSETTTPSPFGSVAMPTLASFALPPATHVPSTIPVRSAPPPQPVTGATAGVVEAEPPEPWKPAQPSARPVRTPFDDVRLRAHHGPHGGAQDPSIVHQQRHSGRHADPSTMGDAMVPVKLRRADGNQTILAYLDLSVSTIFDATTTPDKYYDAAANSSFPFQVTLSVIDGILNATVGNGELIFLFQQNDIAIGDLGTPFNVAIGDLMWLDISISGLSGPTAASIYQSSSSGWAGTSLNFPEPVDFDTDPSTWDGSDPAPAQTHAYLLIAEIIDDGDGSPAVRQCVHTNLQILPVGYFGLTAFVPFAGFGST